MYCLFNQKFKLIKWSEDFPTRCSTAPVKGSHISKHFSQYRLLREVLKEGGRLCTTRTKMWFISWHNGNIMLTIKDKEEHFSTIRHTIKNYLNPAMGFLQLLHIDPKGESAESYIETIFKELSMLNHDVDKEFRPGGAMFSHIES